MVKYKTDNPLTIADLKKALDKMPPDATLHIQGKAVDVFASKNITVNTFVESIYLDVANNKVILNF